MSDRVERFEPTTEEIPTARGRRIKGTMKLDPFGPWVRYSDYEKLERGLEREIELSEKRGRVVRESKAQRDQVLQALATARTERDQALAATDVEHKSRLHAEQALAEYREGLEGALLSDETLAVFAKAAYDEFEVCPHREEMLLKGLKAALDSITRRRAALQAIPIPGEGDSDV